MKTLVLATRNRHKVREIGEILRVPGLVLVSALDFPEVPDVEEDGDTFEANAGKKATALALATGLWALADDSGLEVESLGGAPGVLSARYAGEPVSYPANNRKLLRDLEAQTNRRARFRCVVALSSPAGRVRAVTGICPGHIAREENGTAGFGYDPLFIPDGYAQTFADMDADLKNRLSHRGRALEEALRQWGVILESLPPDWP